NSYSVDDLILNYDPEHPQKRFRQAGLEAAMKSSTGRLPGPVPWPRGHAPAAAPLAQPPAETDDLGRFRGYDVVVVTWTSAEAARTRRSPAAEFPAVPRVRVPAQRRRLFPAGDRRAGAVQRPGCRYGAVFPQPGPLHAVCYRWRAGPFVQVGPASRL